MIVSSYSLLCIIHVDFSTGINIEDVFFLECGIVTSFDIHVYYYVNMIVCILL